ncbi:hypothetical protein BO70DRAFT_175656 [Aspergillus heteromorphus CBS 117.55]|uniref:Secreted protein n=1 Tax=Aspergillus heteromorphus CBS 117.55 TaxID=1448321 RepID=A0A317UWV0_9EURO|nr:uncharacterized protein BO70DRAFT_175656 [Aspergillus heteromorphus CBS 117.55]PWY65986.1 hypothetical protein BO70DRAFT_175656 [Aspergillus heteromorphus CBS 117.55]
MNGVFVACRLLLVPRSSFLLHGCYMASRMMMMMESALARTPSHPHPLDRTPHIRAISLRRNHNHHPICRWRHPPQRIPPVRIADTVPSSSRTPSTTICPLPPHDHSIDVPLILLIRSLGYNITG